MVEVRPYRPGDLPALYDICLKTGDNGADGTHLYEDHRIIGEIFAAPYALLEPQHAFVAEDDEGVAGYILGTADTRAFEARLEAEWWPRLRGRYADTADVPLRGRTREQWDAYYIHHPPTNPQAVVDLAPAHLHIDLLPRLQGAGVGRRLMDTWLEAIGGRAHLGCQPPNVRAQRFYERYGWRRLDDIPPKTVCWMVFGA
ncbi:GNAT family N-acetyltransferase [Phenylobacterium sp.]|uniref:GNAT family N-acetyltransferase n=1 Tax=Phenylobacterium sp. TaxID=1871053 RepID=UPI0025EE1EDE|nr:GNAT family N-acetyltransferase [Phenylobacterium sp.]MBX3483321.1 GNAT family N-acetyltransferase [Phenylobacterium sp.]